MVSYLNRCVAAREKDVWKSYCQTLSIVTTNVVLKNLRAKWSISVVQSYLMDNQFVDTLFFLHFNSLVTHFLFLIIHFIIAKELENRKLASSVIFDKFA